MVEASDDLRKALADYPEPLDHIGGVVGFDVLQGVLAENDRLRKVIAHLMTNPLGTREVTHHTSDIDGQTARVDIIDHDNDRTTIRITEQQGA